MSEYVRLRALAMMGKGQWPTVPEECRPLSFGALAHPTNRLVRQRDNVAWHAMHTYGGESFLHYLDMLTEKLRRP